MDTGKKEYTFQWFIENYSYCWHKNGEKLISPEFSTDSLEETAWNMQLYPRGKTNGYKGWISLYLNRSSDDAGPRNISVEYELSFLAADGSTLLFLECEYTFNKNGGSGPAQYLNMDEVISSRKSKYLTQDTLSVQCKIWRGKGEVQPQAQIKARTRIGIEQISFLHLTENFSKLEPNHKETKQIKYPSKIGPALSCSLYFPNNLSADGEIMVEITPIESKYILSTCRLSLIDSRGNKIDCGEIDNRLDATGSDIRKLALSFFRQEILDKKIEYLPGDTLSVSSECKFSTGKVDYEKIENTVHDVRGNIKRNTISNHLEDIYAEQHSACPSVVNDFKSIYDNQFLTDVEVKTKTKSFPAHKIVLCARSSVFKMMLTNDMKERNTNCIQIDDLEDDTVEQFLLFLYSDAIENLEWDSAIKLYYPGDKYAVEKLKLMCSSFLVKNLSTSNASELLLLADKHSDSYLKKTVEDFILSHDEAVFSSEEWRNLIKANPVLVSETMCLKYIRN